MKQLKQLCRIIASLKRKLETKNLTLYEKRDYQYLLFLLNEKKVQLKSIVSKGGNPLKRERRRKVCVSK